MRVIDTGETPHQSDVFASWSAGHSAFLRTIVLEQLGRVFVLEPSSSLQINGRRFEVVWDGLVDETGRRYRRADHRALLCAAASRDESASRGLTDVERAAGVREVRQVSSCADRDALRPLIARLADQVVRRTSRVLAKGSGHLTRLRIASHVRRLIRSAIARLLPICRQQRVEEQPEALTHQHVVDQYRIRGPNRARKTTSMTPFALVFREFATA
ncbi:hypothetical protein [Virgisporangium aurantiacum]|uniref:hypothetical protein n=1 Tax=Virgisporangium aurantiacum TaxID=175570 RepID=UPI0019506FA1|nr:hypothetical protein [Virgisporangium aurantiacum]